MTKWQELVNRFQALAEITGTDKASSYSVKIEHDMFGPGIYISMGTYDIGDWPRHTNLGPFDTEGEALSALEKKITEAEQTVKKEKEIEKVTKWMKQEKELYLEECEGSDDALEYLVEDANSECGTTLSMDELIKIAREVLSID